MTEVAFHFNAPDRLHYACRLLRKAVAQQSRVVVVGGREDIDALDTLMWTFSALDFVAHCRASDAPALVAASPVVLLAEGQGSAAAAGTESVQVMVNLGHTVPQGFERFARLVEIVTAQEDDRQAARARWRHYSQRGYPLQSHDVAASSH